MLIAPTYSPTHPFTIYDLNNAPLNADTLAQHVYSEFTRWVSNPDDYHTYLHVVSPIPASNREPTTNLEQIRLMRNLIAKHDYVQIIVDTKPWALPFSNNPYQWTDLRSGKKRNNKDLHPKNPYVQYWTTFDIQLEQLLGGTAAAPGSIFIASEPDKLSSSSCSTTLVCINIALSLLLNVSSSEYQDDILRVPMLFQNIEPNYTYDDDDRVNMITTSLLYMRFVNDPLVCKHIHDRLTRYGKVLLADALEDTYPEQFNIIKLTCHDLDTANHLAFIIESRLPNGIFVGVNFENQIFFQISK